MSNLSFYLLISFYWNSKWNHADFLHVLQLRKQWIQFWNVMRTNLSSVYNCCCTFGRITYYFVHFAPVTDIRLWQQQHIHSFDLRIDEYVWRILYIQIVQLNSTQLMAFTSRALGDDWLDLIKQLQGIVTSMNLIWYTTLTHQTIGNRLVQKIARNISSSDNRTVAKT